MKVRVRLRPEAEQDLLDAAIWYEERRSGLGDQFLDEVDAALKSIAEQPQMYAVLYRATRRVLMRRFPFGIYYRIDETGAVVVALMHASRDPKHWKKRAT